MATLLSKQALVYLFESLMEKSMESHQPFQTVLTDEQLDKLFAIIQRANQTIFGTKQHPTTLEQISFIVFQFNKHHILSDGNKRFSLLIALYLCSEYDIPCHKMSPSDWEMYIMRIASDSHFTLTQATDYLREKL